MPLRANDGPLLCTATYESLSPRQKRVNELSLLTVDQQRACSLTLSGEFGQLTGLMELDKRGGVGGAQPLEHLRHPLGIGAEGHDQLSATHSS
jgi:hypothetical protein